MSDVRACGAFVGVQSGIKILQVSLQLLNKSGPDSLIFFNESSKMALKVRNLTDVLGILMLFNQIMKKLKKIHMNFLVWAFWESVVSKVAVASCNHQESKLRAVVGAEGF